MATIPAALVAPDARRIATSFTSGINAYIRSLNGKRPRRGYGHRGMALVILLCAQLMVILDATVVNIAPAPPLLHKAICASGTCNGPASPRSC